MSGKDSNNIKQTTLLIRALHPGRSLSVTDLNHRQQVEELSVLFSVSAKPESSDV